MNLVNWNPIREFDEFLNPFGGRLAARTRALEASGWLPPVDIAEGEDAYHIDVELPAVASDDITVTVKDSVLTVSGERRREDLADGRRHRVERRFGKFSRSFRLPEDVDEDAIDASAKDGLLRLKVRKREQATPRAIPIQVH